MDGTPLDGEVVVDLSSGIAGAYATKVLADAGATVLKIEDPDGDRLRRWTSSGADLGRGEDGALFRFLACSKRSVVVDPDDLGDVELVRELIASANGVVWSPGSRIADLAGFDPPTIADTAPHATVLSITPFGLEGPWASNPSSEATLQSWAGSPGQRGSNDTAPLLAGGRLAEWASGLLAATSYLVSRHRRVGCGDGVGELVDVSGLEAACLTMVMYPVTFDSIAGSPRIPTRVVMLPGVHPASDGFVGFMVVTGQQWLDFCAMVERPDWADDEDLGTMMWRLFRRDELLPHIDQWMGGRTCAEVADLASALRIPVAVLGDGASLLRADHLVDGGFFEENPDGGFVQPTPAHRFGGTAQRRRPEPPPALGEHTASIRAEARSPLPAPAGGTAPLPRPFEGLRVADFTANWAGPIIGHVLAMFGADVIKIESANRPDALRFNTIKPMTEDGYWEWSPLQHGPNTCKRGITLDMATDRGRSLAFELLERCDVGIENYSPRVVEEWGFTWDALHERNPRLIFVRAPAYGLAGPWRDRVGYAQTIEMTSGLAMVTGFVDASPDIPNGFCDPNAGLHATVGLLLALEHRRRTGEGMLLEVPMVGGALNVAAEQVIEYAAYGSLLGRNGNRARGAAPQGIYKTATDDLPFDQGRWITISIEADEQWAGLRRALGEPAWADDPELRTSEGRRTARDRLDEQLAAWCATQDADAIVDRLWQEGVPVAKVALPHEQRDNAQLAARGYFTELVHPVTGRSVHGGFPATFSAGPAPSDLHLAPPPTLGQHNREVLSEVLGLSDDEIAALEADAIIGTKVGGGSAW